MPILLYSLRPLPSTHASRVPFRININFYLCLAVDSLFCIYFCVFVFTEKERIMKFTKFTRLKSLLCVSAFWKLSKSLFIPAVERVEQAANALVRFEKCSKNHISPAVTEAAAAEASGESSGRRKLLLLVHFTLNNNTAFALHDKFSLFLWDWQHCKQERHAG